MISDKVALKLLKSKEKYRKELLEARDKIAKADRLAEAANSVQHYDCAIANEKHCVLCKALKEYWRLDEG